LFVQAVRNSSGERDHPDREEMRISDAYIACWGNLA